VKKSEFVRISGETFERMKKYKNESSVPYTAIANRAINSYLDNVIGQKTKGRDV